MIVKIFNWMEKNLDYMFTREILQKPLHYKYGHRGHCRNGYEVNKTQEHWTTQNCGFQSIGPVRTAGTSVQLVTSKVVNIDTNLNRRKLHLQIVPLSLWKRAQGTSSLPREIREKGPLLVIRHNKSYSQGQCSKKHQPEWGRQKRKEGVCAANYILNQ